jgi:ribosomal protein L40E
MTIKPCRECRAPVSTRAMVCPHCGYQFWRNSASPAKSRCIVRENGTRLWFKNG